MTAVSPSRCLRRAGRLVVLASLAASLAGPALASAAPLAAFTCTDTGHADPGGRYDCWNWSQDGGTVQPGQTLTVVHDCGGNGIVIAHSIHREEARLQIDGDYTENEGSRVVVVVQNVDNHFGVIWLTGRCRSRSPLVY